MRKLLVATRNPSKLKIFQRELKGFSFEVLSLNEIKNIPPDFEPEEKGETFKENAVIKAKVYGQKSGFLTLADDSGLEVEALDGRPGIYSSRYASGSDQDRYRKLLKAMKNVPDKKRASQFVCVLALYDPEIDQLETYEGICQGRIARRPRGKAGFGYDPVFFFPKFGKTMAQLTPAERSRLSHRGEALKKLKEDLKKFL